MTGASLLDCISIFPVGRKVADVAVNLRHVHRWKLRDCVQAAVALHHGLTPATRNTKDLDPFRRVFVVVPCAALPSCQWHWDGGQGSELGGGRSTG